jgi:hypothetical protein
MAAGVSAPWWTYLFSFGLMWGALSTYWDEVFGYDNHYAHGFGVGLACFPIMLYTEPVALGVRVVVLAAAMGIWSGIVGHAEREELGRGFVIPLSLALVWVL